MLTSKLLLVNKLGPRFNSQIQTQGGQAGGQEVQLKLQGQGQQVSSCIATV